MAEMLARVYESKTAKQLWYHFAIMFEALFILTTVDAGTRVGRFLVQDLLGMAWKPLGRTTSRAGAWLASTLFVGAWGWFLYQGVIDPLGGINSLWPLFGVANQLLAVLAFSLGTTVLIKMGKARHIWATLLPLAWLCSVTITAGLQKIFSADPRLGFLSNAAVLRERIATGGAAKQVAQWEQLLAANYVNSVVAGLFLTLVILVVAVSARQWWRLLTKRETPVLAEEPRVVLQGAAS